MSINSVADLGPLILEKTKKILEGGKVGRAHTQVKLFLTFVFVPSVLAHGLQPLLDLELLHYPELSSSSRFSLKHGRQNTN